MNIPQVLILFRFVLAPVILGLAYSQGEQSKMLIIVLMYLGLFSDIFDGIIARKQNISTATLRRLDSQTDLIFWLSIGFAAWMLHPELIKEQMAAVWIILGMELLCYILSFLKFGKETCTHAFLSKMFGVSLLIAFTSLIGFGHSGFPFFLAITLGLVSHIDRILIIFILPHWTHDIPSSYHAYLIRKGIKIKRHALLNG